jgi:hypothetical protein
MHFHLLVCPRLSPSLSLSTTTESADDFGTRTHTAVGLHPDDILGNTGLSGLEAAPVLPAPGMHPRIPTYIHTETGPPTGHMLHDDDHRVKKQATSGKMGSTGKGGGDGGGGDVVTDDAPPTSERPSDAV